MIKHADEMQENNRRSQAWPSCVAGDAAGNEADIAASCAVSPAPCLNCSYSNSEMAHVVDGEGAVAALPVG